MQEGKKYVNVNDLDGMAKSLKGVLKQLDKEKDEKEEEQKEIDRLKETTNNSAQIWKDLNEGKIEY